MKIKVGDPYGHYCTPYLNGAKLEDCVELDEEAGTAVIIEKDWRTGKDIPDYGGPLGFKTLVVRGQVEARFDSQERRKKAEEWHAEQQRIAAHSSTRIGAES